MRGRSRAYLAATATAAAAAAAGSSSIGALAAPSDPPSFLGQRPLTSNSGGVDVGGNGQRYLEDENGNSYAYLNSLSGYSLAYAQCVRVKIPQENDDDGNAYFYNGRYHAPSMAYASFYLCNQNSGDQCGSCDFGTQYAMELGEFLEYQVDYAQNYCGACAAQCRRRRSRNRRRAEDEQEDEEEDQGGGNGEVQGLNCDTCVDQCALMIAGNDGNDETYYVECQESHQDENGVQYYAGPACDSETGGIVVGLYYDDECTIKSTQYDNDFAFNTFGTIETMCVDCSYGDCDDLYENTYHCYNGVDQQGGDDDMPVCKTFKKASKEWTYAKAKGKNKFVPVLITVLVLGALGCVFSFLSYTYYVRHKRASELKEPIASGDHDNTVPADQGQLT